MLYTCEKCKKSYKSVDEGMKCERSHIDKFETEPELNKSLTYKPGVRFPNEVVMRNQEFDWIAEQGYGYVYTYAKYKLIRELDEEETAELEQERIEREKKEEEEREERRKKAAAKAEQEQTAEPEQEVVG